jgi:hypothetical protein
MLHNLQDGFWNCPDAPEHAGAAIVFVPRTCEASCWYKIPVRTEAARTDPVPHHFPNRELIRLEGVLPNSYGLKETRGLRIYDDSSGHTSPTVRQGSARSLTYRPLVMRPKSFTQDSFEYFAGAAFG